VCIFLLDRLMLDWRSSQSSISRSSKNIHTHTVAPTEQWSNSGERRAPTARQPRTADWFRQHTRWCAADVNSQADSEQHPWPALASLDLFFADLLDSSDWRRRDQLITGNRLSNGGNVITGKVVSLRRNEQPWNKHKPPPIKCWSQQC